jgi:hypothetical protein
MPTWGYVAIGIVVGVILLPLGLWLGFKFFLWFTLRKLKGLVGELEGLDGAMGVPLRVTLHPVSQKPEWAEEPYARSQITELIQAGFEPAGEFDVRELGNVSMSCFTHPENGMAAYLCKHPALDRCFLDIIHVFEDGSSLTVSDAQDTKTDACPLHPNIKLTGAPPKKLMEEAARRAQSKPVKSIKTDQVKQTFEQGYAAIMDWRVEKGGVSEEEIRAQAGDDMTPDDLAEARETFRQQHLVQVAELLKIRFSEQTDVSIKEWEDVRDRLLFVHEKMQPDDLLTMFSEEMFYWSEHDFNKPSSGGQRGFEELLKQLPEPLNVRELGTVSGNIEARVYVCPEPPHDEC